MNINSVRVLWADDQEKVQATLSGLLRGATYEIVHARDGASALSELQKSHFDVLILDLKMPPGEWGGLWLLNEMRKFPHKIPVLVLSGEGTQSETIKALRAGATDYVTKDRAETELAERLGEVLTLHGPGAQLRSLLAEGESPSFECKETIRWNIHAQRMDKIPEGAVAKTLAAFLNTSGGVLAVGVKDSGESVGLAQDKFTDRDAALLHLDNIIKNFLTNSVAPLIRAHFVELGGKEVLKIDCKASRGPVYLTPPSGGDVEFYIRRQASSVKLRVDEAVSYIQHRFPPT